MKAKKTLAVTLPVPRSRQESKAKVTIIKMTQIKRISQNQNAQVVEKTKFQC